MISNANMWFNTEWRAYFDKATLPLAFRHGLGMSHAACDAPPLVAHVNHGFWIVDCECNGAEYAWEEGYMVCHSCLNAATHPWAPAPAIAAAATPVRVEQNATKTMAFAKAEGPLLRHRHRRRGTLLCARRS